MEDRRSAVKRAHVIAPPLPPSFRPPAQVTYLASHPNLITTLALFSLCSAFGQIFIFWTILAFDSLTLATITTTRKFFTILMSVLVHGNRLMRLQWVAVAVVFSGLALEAFESKITGSGGSKKHEKHKVEPAATGGGAAKVL